MNTFAIILIAITVFLCINTCVSLVTMVFSERKAVDMGYPPYSNFAYYKVVLPFILWVMFFILAWVYQDYFIVQTSILHVSLCSIAMFVMYTLFSMVCGYILSVAQANKAKKENTNED